MACRQFINENSYQMNHCHATKSTQSRGKLTAYAAVVIGLLSSTNKQTDAQTNKQTHKLTNLLCRANDSIRSLHLLCSFPPTRNMLKRFISTWWTCNMMNPVWKCKICGLARIDGGRFHQSLLLLPEGVPNHFLYQDLWKRSSCSNMSSGAALCGVWTV